MALQHWHYSSIRSPFTTILEYLTYRCPATMENPCLSLITYTKPAKGLLCFVSLSISFSLFAPKVPSWITNPGLPSPEPSECRFVPPRRFPTDQAKLIQSLRSDAEWMVTPEKKKKSRHEDSCRPQGQVKVSLGLKDKQWEEKNAIQFSLACSRKRSGT